jgi:hypothetical protein
LLNRESFRDIKYGQVHIRTTKQGQRIKYTCPRCSRNYKVAARRVGEKHLCSHCGKSSRINPPEGVRIAAAGPPEQSPPVVESAVLGYLQDYLDTLRPDQEWFFESRPGERLHPVMLRRIFCFYAKQAGLNEKYSWHALRHGRGVFINDKFDDLVMVRDSLRQKSLSAAEFYVNLSPKKQARYQKELDEEVGKMDLGLEPEQL